MRRIAAIIVCISMMILSGCNGAKSVVEIDYKQNTTGVWDIKESPLNGAPLIEDKSVYAADNDGEVTEIYLTVREGKDKKLKPVYTFDKLNAYTGEGEEPYCEVIFKEGKDGQGPSIGMFAYGEDTVNGRLELKGDFSDLGLRSYQIKLYDRAGLWNGVRVINLYKNQSDLSRMKNKLGFDALEKLENIAGLRTKFIHLYIKDLTGGKRGAFKDYGLYTYIEQPNKMYLSSRGFDEDGNLYKAKNFDFSRNEDKILNVDDENYSKEKFEGVLTIRESKDHKKLIEMLDMVNDYNTHIDEVIRGYFNEENLLTFAAVNILFGNFKGMYDNYLLYSPENSNTWYIFPSDFKGIFKELTGGGDNLPDDIFVGLPMLYDNVLFRRFFSIPQNIEKLNNKVTEIHKIINGDFVKKQTDIYKKGVLPILYSMPDLVSLPKAAEYVERYIKEFPDILENNYKRFKENLQNPIPPYITTCEYVDGGISLKWQESNDNVTYRVEIANDPDYNSIIYFKDNITENSSFFEHIYYGIYYIRVKAIAPDGREQVCANIYKDNFGDRYYGTVMLIVG